MGNFLFSIPLTICFGIFGLIGYLTGFQNILVWCLAIIPVFPLYSGLVMIARKYAVEKKDINIVETFKKCVKDNWKAFLIHGVITYLIITLSSFAILYYYSLSSANPVYSALLTLYMFFTAMLIAVMFYVPVISITYDVRIRDVYKNSFFIMFGKILRSVIALIAVLIPSAVAFFALMFARGAWLVVAGSLVTLFYPLFYTYISVGIVSKGIQDAMGPFIPPEKASKITEEDKAIGEKLSKEKDSDYIFVNGKMIKNNKH